MHGSVSDLGSILDSWLAEHDDGIACVIRADTAERTFEATPRVRLLTPELSKGLEFDLVVLVDPEAFGTGIEGAVDRYVAMSRATERLVILRVTDVGAESGGQTTESGSSWRPVGPIWISVSISGQTPQS